MNTVRILLLSTMVFTATGGIASGAVVPLDPSPGATCLGSGAELQVNLPLGHTDPSTEVVQIWYFLVPTDNAHFVKAGWIYLTRQDQQFFQVSPPALQPLERLMGRTLDELVIGGQAVLRQRGAFIQFKNQTKTLDMVKFFGKGTLVVRCFSHNLPIKAASERETRSTAN